MDPVERREKEFYDKTFERHLREGDSPVRGAHPLAFTAWGDHLTR